MASRIRSSFRRSLFQALLASCASIMIAAPAQAATELQPSSLSQAPGYYRIAIGDFEVTALFDGLISLDPGILRGLSETTLQARLAGMYVPVSDQGVQTAVNAFLVNTGANLILVDAGAASCFGPTLGAVVENLGAAGYSPEQVDTVLLTHLHGDHACGLATADGSAAFPNATVYVPKEEAGFWLNDDIAAQAPEELKPFFTLAKKSVSPYIAAGRFKPFKAGDALLDGTTSVLLPGHTPGHGGYLFSSRGQEVLVWGDIVHSHAVQFAHPEVSIEFDVDSQQAVATRKAILARAVKEQLWIAGAHLPFPGLGHVRAQEAGYDWVPAEYAPYQAPAAVGSSKSSP